MGFFSNFLNNLRGGFLEEETTADVLRERYSQMNDTELKSIDEAELTPEARAIFREVKSSRSKK